MESSSVYSLGQLRNAQRNPVSDRQTKTKLLNKKVKPSFVKIGMEGY